MKWYKASNDLIDDSKLRLISKRLDVKHCETVATFHSLLCRCSKLQSNDLSKYLDHLADEIDLQLGTDKAESILIAFEEMGILKGGILLKWDNFQGSSSTERVKEWRKKKQNETLQNVTVTNVTQRRVEENRVDKSIKKEPPTPLLPEWLPKDDWRDFLEMRKKKEGRLTARQEALAVTSLDGLRQKGHDSAAIIQQSIARGWKTFYEIKEDYGTNTRANTGINAGTGQRESGTRGKSALAQAADRVAAKISAGTLFPKTQTSDPSGGFGNSNAGIKDITVLLDVTESVRKES